MNLPTQLNLEHLKDKDISHQNNIFPERVLQIGEGNFMRGFIDWMVFEMNNKTNFQGSVVTIQPTPRGKIIPKLNRQDGLYTLVRRGIEYGKPVEKIEIISSITRGINPYSDWDEALTVATSEYIEFLFSNTTEAGLVYEKEAYQESVSPLSFPGKVVALLFHRYQYYNGAKDKGWIIIPCELVENNGDVLKSICQQIIKDWKLPILFSKWIDESCTFCNTLVDRIVPGYPDKEADNWFERLGYSDELLTMAEPYHLFVIEGPKQLSGKLPFVEAGLNVKFEPIEFYRNLKVRLLNGPHSIMSVIGLQLEVETVKEALEHPLLGNFIQNVMRKEIALTLPKSEDKKINEYISEVIDRFSNPYLHHLLKDISLNSYSKFYVRLWPIVRESDKGYRKKLLFSLATLITFFYNREGIKDNEEVVSMFAELYSSNFTNQSVLQKFIEEKILLSWGMDTAEISDVAQELVQSISIILNEGMEKALALQLK